MSRATRNKEPAIRPKSLEARVHEHYPSLPESERRIADVILDFPGELASYSATELVNLAGVSKAAASRLFKRLGFESFEEARRLVRDAKKWGSPLYLHEKALAVPDTYHELQIAVEDHSRAVTRSLAQVDPGKLEEAMEALLAANRVWMVGFRNSYAMAAYARSQFLQIRKTVLLLPPPGETLGEYMAEFDAGDLLFVVGMRRRVPQLRRTMEAANRAGTPIINITDATATRTRRLATWNFICEINSRHLFDTYVGPTALIHYMSILAMRKAGKAGRTRLEEIEIQHEILSEFE